MMKLMRNVKETETVCGYVGLRFGKHGDNTKRVS